MMLEYFYENKTKILEQWGGKSMPSINQSSKSNLRMCNLISVYIELLKLLKALQFC